MSAIRLSLLCVLRMRCRYNGVMSYFHVPTIHTFLLAILMAGICAVGSAQAVGNGIKTIDVHTDPRGGVVAHATLNIAAPPAVVQQILTDYEHWPELFTVSMRMARIERYPDRVVTDIYLKHGFLSGERRLLGENRELPEGGVHTTMLEGDFRRYSRTWKISSDGTNKTTKAEFHLEVEVDTLAPDWLVATMMKRELESHFQILNEKASQRAGLSPGH